MALLRPHNALKKTKDALKSSPLLSHKISGALMPNIQNAGDFRTHKDGGVVGLHAHDIQRNMALNFVISIRRDLGLSVDVDPQALVKKSDSRVEEILKP